MTAQEEHTLHLFEAKVRTLIEKYKQLREENVRLQSKVEAGRNEIKDLQSQLAKEKQTYSNLKLSRMLELSSGDNEAARKRLNHIIQEIDKCIALLNL